MLNYQKTRKKGYKSFRKPSLELMPNAVDIVLKVIINHFGMLADKHLLLSINYRS